jgi:MoaA/NifB/PqqE/SkfB family radical SAM enzyme
MCDIHRNKPSEIALNDAIRVLDFMANNGFLIAYFTGGEPALHPNVVEIVNYADELGMLTSITTNGTILPKTLEKLYKAGLHTLSVSVDFWDPEFCEKTRGFKDIHDRCKETIKFAKSLDMKVYSLTYLGPHITSENIETMVKYANETLAIPFALCYPTTTSTKTYVLGNNVNAPSPDNLKEIAQKLLELKKSGYKIANTATYLGEIVKFHNEEQTDFPCKCGEYVFYIDWFGDVYPCFAKKKLFNVLKEDKAKNDSLFLKDVKCNNCMVDCFREPSYIAYVKHPSMLVKELKYNFPLREIFF